MKKHLTLKEIRSLNKYLEYSKDYDAPMRLTDKDNVSYYFVKASLFDGMLKSRRNGKKGSMSDEIAVQSLGVDVLK